MRTRGYAEDLELPGEASTEAAELAPEPEEPTESSEVPEEELSEETEEPTEPEEATEETSEEETEEELSTGEPEEPEVPAGPEEEPASIAEEPVINVLLPSSGKIVVNPYGLEVPTEYGVSRDQVVHAPQSLTNLSDVPVTVNVRVTGSFAPESGAYLVTAPPAPEAPWSAEDSVHVSLAFTFEAQSVPEMVYDNFLP